MGRRKKSFYKKVARNAPDSCKRIENPKEEKSSSWEKGDLYPNCDTSIWLRSCEEEVINPIDGVSRGAIPTWLEGSLLRNGPGSLKVGEMEFDHLFDSSALLHRYHIKEGKVTYQNRFLRSETFKKNQEAQRIVVTEFGTSAVPDPCHTIFKRVSAIFNPAESQSDNAMISVYPFGDKLFAMTETPVIYEINTESLATGTRYALPGWSQFTQIVKRGVTVDSIKLRGAADAETPYRRFTAAETVNLGSKLGIINHTSHPHVMADGTVYNLGMAVYKTGPRYCILRFPPKTGNSVFDEAEIIATVPSRWRFHPSYMHTFGITESFFIIVEQPLSISVTAIVKNAITNQPIASALRWYQDSETRILLISRASGRLEHTFSTDSFFYLHIINQYEENEHVVLDICCYKDPSMLDCMYISALKEAQKNSNYAGMFRGRPLRFVLPLRRNSAFDQCNKKNLNTLQDTQSEANLLQNGSVVIKPELLCSLGCETPRINYEQYCGKKYRYFYAISSDVDATNPGMLIKVDTKTRTKKTWGIKNMYPSEPIFVKRPGGLDEDDGVVISAVVWGGENTNETGLVVLDAKNWTEMSLTTFTVNGPVPKCLHGWFVNN